MVIFEMITLDIPYRADTPNHFDIGRKIEEGIRPTLPAYVLENPEYASILE